MKKTFRKGQTMVEYIIIVALVAIALIGIFSFFGKTVHTKVKGAANEMTETKSSESYQGQEQLKKLGEND